MTVRMNTPRRERVGIVSVTSAKRQSAAMRLRLVSSRLDWPASICFSLCVGMIDAASRIQSLRLTLDNNRAYEVTDAIGARVFSEAVSYDENS